MEEAKLVKVTSKRSRPTDCDNHDDWKRRKVISQQNEIEKFDWKQQNDYIILKILKACDVKTLLRLTETCKRFNELISSSTVLMKRIQFNMTRVTWDYSGKSFIPLAELRAIHGSVISNQRKYGKLRIVATENDSQSEFFLGIVDAIGKTIDEVEFIFEKKFSRDGLMRIMLAVQNVEKFFLNNYAVLNPADLQQLEEQNFNFMAKVKHFKLFSRNYCGVSILKLFRECKDLESLELLIDIKSKENSLIIDDFFAQQNQLKLVRLHIAVYAPILSNWPAFRFKLKSLEVDNVSSPLFVPEFFIQQDQLESLAICDSFVHNRDIDVQQLFNTMKAILKLQKLKKLELKSFGIDRALGSYLERFFSDLHNDTIEELNVHHSGKLIRIANSLQALEKICIHETCVDLSELRLDVITKIHFHSAWQIIYSPPEVPDREELESVFIKCFKNRNAIHSLGTIRIGHPNWLRHRQLTFEFCKHLIEKSPQLEKLVLFNVHDCYDELRAYLTDNKPPWLTKIKLNGEMFEPAEAKINN